MNDYKKTALWKKAFEKKDDGFNEQRQLLEVAYDEFRSRVSQLVANIQKDMPSLTLHDITHIDALWGTASEIAGEDFPLNPAEAFVLGGTFLLHDAAHCILAYPNGIAEIRALPAWKQCAANIGVSEYCTSGSDDFHKVLFDFLRVMHPIQAENLPGLYWEECGNRLYLIPNDDLRSAYGAVIGEVAKSHWSYPHELESLHFKRITTPVFLSHAPWDVDVLNIAVLLRTADAAHIDAQRAPTFTKVLIQPQDHSNVHWVFQNKINKVKIDSDLTRHELKITSAPFLMSEQDAWWMAYDTANMIDKELRAVDRLLLDLKRQRLSARSVLSAHTTESFSLHVPTQGWYPVDTSIKLTNIKLMVERFGGEKLYGAVPAAALRELLQNAIDAIHACRLLGGLGAEEGRIDVSTEESEEGCWLHVTDQGIGMSRYVLTEVLLDFGKSLWKSSELSGEWGQLKETGFEAIGQFGVGFFSVFMLGSKVKVVTRRYEQKNGEKEQWMLDFIDGGNKRPVLREPDLNERLKRHGTRISVFLSKENFTKLVSTPLSSIKFPVDNLAAICAWLAPAIDINLYVKTEGEAEQCVVRANDWLTMPALDLLKRISPLGYERKNLFVPELSQIRGENGDIKGRCAVNTLFLRAYSFGGNVEKVGVGVVKGLYAGVISGFEGLVFTRNQFDLARKEASPDISISELSMWATEQSMFLPKARDEQVANSALLTMFGSDCSNIIVGEMGGVNITFDKLILLLNLSDEFIVCFDGVSYDSYDDNVAERDFDSSFVSAENVLFIGFCLEPSWLGKFKNEEGFKVKDIESVLTSAFDKYWVDWECVIHDEYVVGKVEGVNIYRECTVYTRH